MTGLYYSGLRSSGPWSDAWARPLGGDVTIDIDASRSSSVYTNSFNKVQPDSTQIYLYMKLN